MSCPFSGINSKVPATLSLSVYGGQWKVDDPWTVDVVVLLEGQTPACHAVTLVVDDEDVRGTHFLNR